MHQLRDAGLPGRLGDLLGDGHKHVVEAVVAEDGKGGRDCCKRVFVFLFKFCFLFEVGTLSPTPGPPG